MSHYWCSALWCRVTWQTIERNREALCVVAPSGVVEPPNSLHCHFVWWRLSCTRRHCKWKGTFCVLCYVGSGLGYAWSYNERVGSWLVLERVIKMSREVYINDTLVWGFERGGSYILCSHLRVAASRGVRSWMDHACWTMSREVRWVGLWLGRFVELDHERASSWKYWNP